MPKDEQADDREQKQRQHAFSRQPGTHGAGNGGVHEIDLHEARVSWTCLRREAWRLREKESRASKGSRVEIHRPSQATFQPQWRRGAWYTLSQSLQTNARALACVTRFVDLDKPLVEAWGRDSLGHTSSLGVCVQTTYNCRASRQPVRYERARSSRMLGATSAYAASGLEGAINALSCLACADCEITLLPARLWKSLLVDVLVPGVRPHQC